MDARISGVPYDILAQISDKMQQDDIECRPPATGIELPHPTDAPENDLPSRLFGLPVRPNSWLRPGEYILTYETGGNMELLRRSILDDASERVEGNARDDYGPPADNAERIAVMWNALGYVRYGKRWCPINGSDVCAFQRGLKEAREANRHKRDNFVDIAGWAAVEDEVKR